MNKKRLIITSVISIVLVAVLMVGSTYSIFTTTEVDESANVYKTGVLDITYTLSDDNIVLTENTPVSNDDICGLNPYRITVTNNGTVPYKFNVILNDTTASNVIDSQYIGTQVGKLEPILLSDTMNNIIKEGIVVLANSSVSIDVRVFVSDTIQNTEIGKSFYAKLAIDGIAVYSDEDEIDYSDLEADICSLLSGMSVGSYVAYTGNNGCSGEACNGQNINYVSDSNMGYCASSSDKYTVNGWRIGYIENGSVYLVSAGATDCICTDVTNEVQNVTGEVTGIVCAESLSTEDLYKHYDNMDSLALGYCNTNFAYGGQCNSSSAWAMDETDFGKITSSTLSSCYGLSSNACGNNNDLINNGGYYWFASQYLSYGESFIWDPSSRYVYSNSSYVVRGVRPILRLANSVSVIGGTGTYADPYVITN